MIAVYRMLALGIALLGKQGALEPDEPFKALSQLTGADSLIESPRVVLVKDAGTWRELWREHRNGFHVSGPGSPNIVDGSPAPQMNFDDDVVLALFGGQSRNVSAFEIVEAKEVKDVCRVRIRPVILPGRGVGVLQDPFIMIVLPRSRKKMTVELDQSLLGGDGWRLLSQFEPTKKATQTKA